MLSRDKHFYSSFFSLAGTIALQNIVVFSVNLADNIMIGGYSEAALGGVAMANQIQYLLMMLVVGASNGMIVICSQYWGQKRIEPIKRVFSVAVTLGTVLSALLAAAVLIFPENVLRLLTDVEPVIAEGAKYLRIMGWSYCVFAITNIVLGALRSVETVRIGFVISVLALFVNIFLNYGLIYGRMGMPELGIRGAAIATLTARLIEMAVALTYLFLIDKKLKIRPLDFVKVEKKYFGDYIKTGLPLVLSNTSWGIAITVQTAILGRLGASAISANSIATTLFQVVGVLHTSSGSASSVIIGKTVGEGRLAKVREYSKTLQVLYLAIGVVASAALYFSKSAIISFYNVTPQTAALANTFLNILCVTIIGSAYEMPCLTGIVSGGGDTKFVLFNDLIFMWGMVLPLSMLSAFVFKLPVWVTFALLKSDQVAKCGVAAVKVNRYKWIKKLTN